MLHGFQLKNGIYQLVMSFHIFTLYNAHKMHTKCAVPLHAMETSNPVFRYILFFIHYYTRPCGGSTQQHQDISTVRQSMQRCRVELCNL